ncbi:MAG TPA: hypothetical protein VI336_01850 [Candidatus Saccharimonadales bacterium]|nr:hypothetical protein [Candidatus Saccharimonadales bacterium]
MSEINYEDMRVEGGIKAFADVLKPYRSKPEVGQDLIPSLEGVRRYAEVVESIEESRRLGELALREVDEDLLAA